MPKFIRFGTQWNALALGLALSAPVADAQPSTAAQGNPEVIVVTGRLPGPAPWRVSNGDHVLWIFAHPGVVPATLEWDSARLERALAQSQEYLPVPLLDLEVKFARRRAVNPGDRTLADVLPADVWRDYQALRAELFPDSRSADAIEKFQPHVVGGGLLRNLYDRAGLAEGAHILRRMDQLARAQRGLRTTRIEVKPTRAERRQLRELFAASSEEVSLEQGTRCLAAAIANVRDDLAILQERAKAWAEGVVAELGALQTSRERQNYCSVRLIDSEERAIVQGLTTELWERWHAAVDAALERNVSTVAILDIGMLVDDADNGFLRRLRAQGYTVTIPD